MMAGTYEATHSKVELERLLELYCVTEEFSRSAAVSPPPINIPVLCLSDDSEGLMKHVME